MTRSDAWRWFGRCSLAASLILLGIPVLARAGASLPSPVPDRIGRAQIFDSHIPDKSVLVGRRDVVWSASGPREPGVYAISYMTLDRDLDRTHDLPWYLQNHPDWVVYRCDGRPVSEFTGQYVTVDISQPAVREALFDYEATVRLAKRPFDAIGIDNLANVNGFEACYRRSAAGPVQLYTGRRSDGGFVAREADWLRWLAERAHDRGLALAGNLYYDGHDRAAYERIAAELDIVLEEGGFERDCRPRQTDAAWLDRVTLLRSVAAAKPLISMDTVCPDAAQMTRAVNVWALANYLMIKGDRTYLALVSGREGADYFQDFPELYLPLGRPLGAMERHGGIFVRRFERAMAIVNPSSTSSAMFEAGEPGWRDEVTGAAAAGAIDVPPASAVVLIR